MSLPKAPDKIIKGGISLFVIPPRISSDGREIYDTKKSFVPKVPSGFSINTSVDSAMVEREEKICKQLSTLDITGTAVALVKQYFDLTRNFPPGIKSGVALNFNSNGDGEQELEVSLSYKSKELVLRFTKTGQHYIGKDHADDEHYKPIEPEFALKWLLQ